MGIKGCQLRKVLWVASGLTLKSLKDLNIGNRIDVDGNALAWKLGAGKHISEVAQIMASFLKNLAHSGGFEVTVIVDGERPDCKRDTWFRRKERELDEINRLYCRFKALELGSNNMNKRSSNINEEDATFDTMKRDFDLFSSESKSLENKCKRTLSIPKDFGTQISERLMMINACNTNENGGVVKEKVLVAGFQADSLIARRAMQNDNDFILAEDSDFAALLGEKCILIKNVKEKPGRTKRGRKKKRDNAEMLLQDSTFFNVDLVGACNNKMKELKNILENNDRDGGRGKIKWEEASYPLFHYTSHRLRAMIALAMGCDVFKEGLKSFGPAKIFKTIQKLDEDHGEESREARFKQLLIKGTKLDEDVIDTLILSFLFEPGLVQKDHTDYENDEGNQSLVVPSSYIFTPPPASFPKYLKSFAESQSLVVDGPEMRECPGSMIGCKKHMYLAFEGSFTCSTCDNTFCKACAFVPEYDKKQTKPKKNIAARIPDKEQHTTTTNPPPTTRTTANTTTSVYATNPATTTPRPATTCHPAATTPTPTPTTHCPATTTTACPPATPMVTSTTCCRPATTTTSTTTNSMTTTNTTTNSINTTPVTTSTSDAGCKIYYRDCNQVTCLSCFRLSRLSGMEEEVGMNTGKSLEEMVRELSEDFGVQLEQTASLTETIDIYNAYVSSESASRNVHLSDVRDKVMFPILAAESLDDRQRLSKLGSFKFCNGGRFINDQEMVKEEDLPGVLNLISSCLEHDISKQVHKNQSDVGDYGHLPTMLLNFAYLSRVDSGFRLLDRCARHACDPKTTSLFHTAADLFKYNGKFMCFKYILILFLHSSFVLTFYCHFFIR